MEFKVIKTAVARKFEELSKHTTFRTLAEKDEMWNTYINSFPEGTNPVFRKRTEHDCACCRQFIRAVGNIVAVVNGKLVSVWDISIPEEPAYQAVADAMAALVKSKEIANRFLSTEKTAGTDKNFEDILGNVTQWNHFFVNIPRELVVTEKDIGPQLGKLRDDGTVLQRGVEELTLDAMDTVLELIEQGSLYRGDDNRFQVAEIRKLKIEFDAYPEDQKKFFGWLKSEGLSGAVSRVRNTSIGTLLKDLSGGEDLEVAVRKFEVSVAGPNYKRPTALVSKGMIEKAKKTIEELGLTSALTRRYATINDLTINNILFADRTSRQKITGDVFDDLATKVTPLKSMDKVEEVPIAKFLSDILPKATSLEVMFDGSHAANLVSLIAPEDPTSKTLFKWDNRFSWSYTGDMADSIKQRVKEAGGRIEGDLLCRLAWDYADDLDFHMYEPGGGHVYYSTRRTLSRCGGQLDVDANGIDGPRENPVENIVYPDARKMMDGEYTLSVNNWSRRSDGRGFEVEIELFGRIYSFSYEKALKSGEVIRIAKLKVSKGQVTIEGNLKESKSSKKFWGIDTFQFHKVNAVMLSPNYWDDKGVGNKHFFFMLEGCVNDGTARGFFNEFLNEALTPHRKVMEVVGSKMKAEHSPNQLSGLGFSSTQRNELLVKVSGAFTRVIKVVI